MKKRRLGETESLRQEEGEVTLSFRYATVCALYPAPGCRGQDPQTRRAVMNKTILTEGTDVTFRQIHSGSIITPQALKAGTISMLDGHLLQTSFEMLPT